jgi:hypothetical protein
MQTYPALMAAMREVKALGHVSGIIDLDWIGLDLLPDAIHPTI